MKQGFTAHEAGLYRPEKWRLEECKNIFRVEVKAAEWAFDRTEGAFEQVAQDETGKLSIVQEIMQNGLPAAHHCASWRTRRSYDVPLVPAMQQFPFGRLHLLGLWVKTYILVVRILWREVRWEATKQALGCPNR